MLNRQRNSLFIMLLALGLVLPGLIGIFAVQARAVEDQTRNVQRALQSGPTVTPTFNFNTTPIFSPTVTSQPLTNPGVLSNTSPLTLYAFIQAPVGVVQLPYVNLIGFGSISRRGSVQIRGFVNTQEFICTKSPCVIYLQSSSRLVFRAYSDSGESSEEVVASVSVTQVENGYTVKIDTVSQFTAFSDACSRIWSIRDEESQTWDEFVQFPYQLNTSKTLHTLVARLILNGVVDASSCPAGGLSLGLDWPTGCGLEKARGAMIAWQNQFDDYIWLASRDRGIPPKILKMLIEYESQYWPGNSRFYLDEVGLGQINQLGVDVLLRRDTSYYQKVCASVLSDCTRPYASLEPTQQALIRGAVVASADATCATCANGIDIDKANESIDLIASMLKANCEQVYTIVKQPYKPDADVDAATATAAAATVAAGGSAPGPDYEDYWRFTLVSYHSGLSCFQQAVLATKKSGEPVTWENLRGELKCKGARPYADGLMDNLFAFDSYLYQPHDALPEYALPTIVPTRTPVPTPTVYVSSARIIVQVYMDRNGNGTPDPDEWINAMTVQVTIANTPITQRTQNGIAVFDMSGYTPNSAVDVSLPGLYRSQSLVLPESGDVTVIFKFDQPILPTSLP